MAKDAQKVKEEEEKIEENNPMMDDGLFVAASWYEIKQEKIFRDAFRCTSNFNSLRPVTKANWCSSILKINII